MLSTGQAFTSEDYLFPEEDFSELVEPKFHHARFRISREIKSLSPWITPDSRFRQSQVFHTLEGAQGRARLRSNASRELKYKNVQKQT